MPNHSVKLTDHFRFQIVRTMHQRRLIHRLRYDVYCREFGFEDEQDCPGGLESDWFDDDAIHCLVTHQASGSPAGCVRLVKPSVAPGSDLERLPLEVHCGSSLQPGMFHPDQLPRARVCEISRLAVPAVFRRRAGETRSPYGDPDVPVFSPEEARSFPLLGVGLFLAATAMVGACGRWHAFAMMEEKLARLLGRSGLKFIQIGSPMDYHGLRAAFYIDQREAEQHMNAGLRDLYRNIQEQLYAPRPFARRSKRLTSSDA